MIWKNIYKAISTDLSRINKGKQNLKEHQHILRQGLWLLDVRCSWRFGVGKDAIQTKNAISPPLIETKKKLYSFFYKLTGSSLLYLNKGKNENIEFDIDLVFFSRSDTIKFFDFKNEWVLTYYPTSTSIKSNVNELYKHYFSVFRTVEVEQITVHNIHYKKEKFLPSPILALHPDKLKYAKDIFISYDTYLGKADGIAQPGILKNEIQFMGSVLSDPQFDAFIALHSSHLDAIDKNLLYYPSHGDFNAENIIVHDNQVFIIDLDEFGTLLPGFFDLMYLCRPFELNEAYNKPDFIDLFKSCVAKSFDQYHPDFSYLHFILWIFYNTPYYRDRVKLSPVNKNVLIKSWHKFRETRVPHMDATLAVSK